mmetsp:Transcript_19881/g.22749  ORF Transcript_19881/g.22749 Transcript_19881/m.22749 type:complete len:713 (+) Transcript_19881:302-2440(+)
MIERICIRKSAISSSFLLFLCGNLLQLLGCKDGFNLVTAFTPVYPSSMPSPTAPPTTRLNEYYGDYMPTKTSPEHRNRRGQPTAVGTSTATTPASIRMDGLLRMSNHNHGNHHNNNENYYDDFGDDFRSSYFDNFSEMSNTNAENSEKDENFSSLTTHRDEECILLEWNLSNLLSHDPSTEPKLIPLIDVCDAAKKAIREDPTITQLQSKKYDGKLNEGLAPYRMFVQNYNQDIGHDGRFSVFTGKNDGASLQSEVVFSTEKPLEYIRTMLSTTAGTTEKKLHPADRRRVEEETVVFVPGLHMLHEAVGKNDGERTSNERVQYYSQVLDGLPMAQLHAGTYSDKKDKIQIEITRDSLFALKSFGLLVNNPNESSQERRQKMMKQGEKVYCHLNTKDLDILRTVVSRARLAPFHVPVDEEDDNSSNTCLKKTLIRLIDLAVKSTLAESMEYKGKRSDRNKASHLVLMANSASCSIVASALGEWKRYQTDEEESTEIIESLLREAVTVVTMGAICQNFVDGPAYIHVSMHDDPLASTWGASKDRPGGGKDAVYLHGISPYVSVSSFSAVEGNQVKKKQHLGGLDQNDAHNMDACAVQFLSLVRRINAISSFRDLYNVANQDPDQLDIKASLFAINYHKQQQGQLELPPHLDDELLPSMIRATGGDRRLWNAKEQLGEDGVDGDDSPLPSLDYAEALLTNQLGYNIYDEIVKACG